MPAIELYFEEKPVGGAWTAEEELGTFASYPIRDIRWHIINLEHIRYHVKLLIDPLLLDGSRLMTNGAAYLARMVIAAPGESMGFETIDLNPSTDLPHLAGAEFDWALQLEWNGLMIAERRLRRRVKFNRQRGSRMTNRWQVAV